MGQWLGPVGWLMHGSCLSQSLRDPLGLSSRPPAAASWRTDTGNSVQSRRWPCHWEPGRHALAHGSLQGPLSGWMLRLSQAAHRCWKSVQTLHSPSSGGSCCGATLGALLDCSLALLRCLSPATGILLWVGEGLGRKPALLSQATRPPLRRSGLARRAAEGTDHSG